MAKGLMGADTPEKHIGLLLFSGHLLCGNGLLSLLQIGIRLGLFLSCVLAYCFGGLVAHSVFAFRLLVCSPAVF
jgi:hypothetical protein